MKNDTTDTGAVQKLPEINKLEPNQGKPNTDVGIHGHNFGELVDGEDTYVSFNSIRVVAESWTDTLIVVKVPEASTPGDVVVVLKGMRGNGSHFEVEA